MNISNFMVMVNENEKKFLFEIKDRIEKCTDKIDKIIYKENIFGNDLIDYGWLDCYCNNGIKMYIAQNQKKRSLIFSTMWVSPDGKEETLYRMTMDGMYIDDKCQNGTDMFKTWLEGAIIHFKETLEKADRNYLKSEDENTYVIKIQINS